MIRFLRNKFAPPKPADLGHLESTVMELLWTRGESNVREAMEGLDRKLAYTTVMTTLDRLYKKGLLDRRKSERAFFYSPRLTQREWEQKARRRPGGRPPCRSKPFERSADLLPGRSRGPAG